VTAGIFLAFDFGTQRIGVAVGDAVTRTARALCTIPEDWPQIERLIKEWGPAACVVGLPLDREGEEQAITRKARGFARDLGQRFKGPVHLCDERYSSRSAQDDLRRARSSGAMKRRVKPGDKDSASARLILQQWLEENQKTTA
jgi:putative Holliday junction resolvase